METQKYDVVIVGAGPAGCAAAYMLSGSGLKIALLDKETFPRDKICGDALSADVTKQLDRISKSLSENFSGFKNKISSNGVRFYTPKHQQLDVAFKKPESAYGGGFVAKRVDFDNFFFSEIANLPDIDIFQNQKITSIINEPGQIILESATKQFKASFALGADGAQSILNKKLTGNTIEKNHYCAGVRQYYSNVKGFHSENYIELHFYKEILPGYLWIFPLANNQANVGLGILSGIVSKKQLNLKKELTRLLHTQSALKDRFKEAIPLNDIQGYGLPLGSKKRTLSGNRFLLLGDAAGLIDPFSGEGIANAIRSGRIAAAHVQKAFEQDKFNADFNILYDKEIYNKMWKEFKLDHALQKLFQYPSMINFVAKKANNNQSVKTLLSSMLTDIDLKKELIKPSFYFKLFFT